MILSSDQKKIWDSPWGLIHRNYNTTTSIALHPLTEILIDETSRLQFSKTPASSEPGPMIAGRGVKSLLIDLFWQHIQSLEASRSKFVASISIQPFVLQADRLKSSIRLSEAIMIFIVK